jgi:hypothetical protein
MHLVRSLSFVAMHGQFANGYFDHCVADFAGDPRTLQVFVSHLGRQPAPGEPESLIAAQARKMQASPDLTASGMRRVNSGIPRVLGRYQVQLVEVPTWMPGCARGSASAPCAA